MNNLAVNNNEVLTMTSMEIADMVGRNHKDVLRDIRKVIDHLSTERNYALSDYFIEGKYKDSTGRELTSYSLTKKGCELYATRMTGAKGTLFAVQYIEKFNEMEEKLNPKQPMSSLQMLQTMINQMVEQEQQMKVVSDKVVYLETEFNKETVEEGYKSNDNVARNLNLYSLTNKPHASFVDAIGKHLKIYNTNIGYKDEYVNVVRSILNGGTSTASIYYSEESIQMMMNFVSKQFKPVASEFKRGENKGKFKDSTFELNGKTYKFNEKTYKHYNKI